MAAPIGSSPTRVTGTSGDGESKSCEGPSVPIPMIAGLNPEAWGLLNTLHQKCETLTEDNSSFTRWQTIEGILQDKVRTELPAEPPIISINDLDIPQLNELMLELLSAQKGLYQILLFIFNGNTMSHETRRNRRSMRKGAEQDIKKNAAVTRVLEDLARASGATDFNTHQEKSSEEISRYIAMKKCGVPNEVIDRKKMSEQSLMLYEAGRHAEADELMRKDQKKFEGTVKSQKLRAGAKEIRRYFQDFEEVHNEKMKMCDRTDNTLKENMRRNLIHALVLSKTVSTNRSAPPPNKCLFYQIAFSIQGQLLIEQLIIEFKRGKAGQLEDEWVYLPAVLGPVKGAIEALYILQQSIDRRLIEISPGYVSCSTCEPISRGEFRGFQVDKQHLGRKKGRGKHSIPPIKLAKTPLLIVQKIGSFVQDPALSGAHYHLQMLASHCQLFATATNKLIRRAATLQIVETMKRLIVVSVQYLHRHGQLDKVSDSIEKQRQKLAKFHDPEYGASDDHLERLAALRKEQSEFEADGMAGLSEELIGQLAALEKKKKQPVAEDLVAKLSDHNARRVKFQEALDVAEKQLNDKEAFQRLVLRDTYLDTDSKYEDGIATYRSKKADKVFDEERWNIACEAVENDKLKLQALTEEGDAIRAEIAKAQAAAAEELNTEDNKLKMEIVWQRASQLAKFKEDIKAVHTEILEYRFPQYYQIESEIQKLDTRIKDLKKGDRKVVEGLFYGDLRGLARALPIDHFLDESDMALLDEFSSPSIDELDEGSLLDLSDRGLRLVKKWLPVSKFGLDLRSLAEPAVGGGGGGSGGGGARETPPSEVIERLELIKPSLAGKASACEELKRMESHLMLYEELYARVMNEHIGESLVEFASMSHALLDHMKEACRSLYRCHIAFYMGDAPPNSMSLELINNIFISFDHILEQNMAVGVFEGEDLIRGGVVPKNGDTDFAHVIRTMTYLLSREHEEIRKGRSYMLGGNIKVNLTAVKTVRDAFKWHREQLSIFLNEAIEYLKGVAAEGADFTSDPHVLRV